MASFIIHTIVGEKLLNTLEENYNINISDYDKKQFLLGNLIVDSTQTDKTIPTNLDNERLTLYKMEIKNKIRKEKQTTHFRDPDKEDECIKTPLPELFLEKYYNLLLDNISVLGYLFHLYTDKLFFTKLFVETFDTIDINGNLVSKDNDLKYIRIRKNNEIVDAKEFWAGTSNINIYNDYTIMNKLLLEKFGTSFNKEDFIKFANASFTNPGIEEVSYERINKILSDTNNFIEESYKKNTEELSVFTENAIIEFVNYVVEQFITEYKNILDKMFCIKKKIK